MNAQESIDRYVADYENGINTLPMLGRLVDFYIWVKAGACLIRDVTAKLIPLEFREVQLRVLEKMMKQAAAGKPIRLAVGKSRKTGVSTEVQGLLVYICSMCSLQRAITITHTGPASKELFGIAVRVAKNWAERPSSEDIGGRTELFWTDVDSWYSSGTAGGVAVGAGGTPSALHLSEVAKWERNKEETHYKTTTAVPDIPETIIVQESTFKGRDLFWRTFDEARRGKSNYEAIFIGWWMDPTLWSDPGDHFERTREEQNIARLAAEDGVEMADGMLQWRRLKVVEIGSALFRQEYPTTPQEAIQATKGLILPMMAQALFDELPFDPVQIFPIDRIGGIDFGYADPTAIWSGYRYDSKLWLTQLWWGTEQLADQQAAGLLEGHTYYCDPASLNYRKELQKSASAAGIGCKLVQAPRSKGPGEDVSVIEMRKLIQAVESGVLRIDADIAEDLLIETDTMSWDERTGRPDDRPTPEAHHFDRIMALKYLVMGAMRPKSQPSIVGEVPAGKGRGFNV